MATAQEQLMGMLNPQTARLLDNQMRQKQVAQRSQGAGMLSGLTQAYTGMADAVTGAAGFTPMGANEQQAIQANLKTEQNKTLQASITSEVGKAIKSFDLKELALSRDNLLAVNTQAATSAAQKVQDKINKLTKKQEDIGKLATSKEAVIANLSNNPELTPEAILNITRAVNSGTMSVEAAAKLSVPTGEAPKTREIEKDDKVITQEWNSAKQRWDQVASSDIGAKEVAAAKVAAAAAQKQADNQFGLQFIKDNKKLIAKGMGAVEQSQKAIKTIDSAVGYLNKGVFTGSLVQTRVEFIKLADLIGIDLGIDKASSTEEFAITLLDNLGPLIKSGMFGTGQSITNKDLEIAKSMIAGDPSKTEEAIRGILKKLYVGNQNNLIATQEFMGEIAEIDSNYKRFTISKEAIEETQRVREFGALTPKNGWASVTLNGHDYFTNKEGRLLNTQGYLIQPKEGG